MHPGRNRWLWSLLAALTGALWAAGVSLADMPRPNILWLIAEDLGPQLGCYGEGLVHTPHLDRLAAEGMRCTRAFATGPVCSASRSAFMTGMYQTTIGAHNHRSHRDDGHTLPEGVRILPDWLGDLGYFTANIRRMSGGPGGTGKTDWNFQIDHRPFASADWAELKTHQPFYAQVNFSETHRAFERSLVYPVDPRQVKLPPYYPDHEIARQDWAMYLEAVNVLDQKVGQVLEKLEEDGLADSTIVVFFGDNGQAMPRGKQWCYDTGLQVPLIVRWPRGLAAPAGYEAGAVVEDLVSLLDVTATTLAVAGGVKPSKMQGRVLLGAGAEPVRDYVFGARDRCDETVFRIRTVRDVRYRYIRNFEPERPFLQFNRYKETSYPIIPLMRRLHRENQLTPAQAALMTPRRPAEELYDLQEDPHEVRNLAASPDHQQVLQRLREALDSWIVESDDQGRYPEPPETVRHWEAQMKKTYDAKIERIWREMGLLDQASP